MGPRYLFDPRYTPYALATRFERMHAVHTCTRLVAPATVVRTVWRFGYQRLVDLLFACETWFPNDGPLPHTLHFRAILKPRFKKLYWAAKFTRL
jgi:hypothetical protein